MKKFKIGQKVVCIKTGKPGISKLIIGKVYTIMNIYICENCKMPSYYVGLSHTGVYCPCNKITFSFGIAWHSSDKFAPLKYNDSTEEILEKFKLIEEKSDVEIKELETIGCSPISEGRATNE